MILYIMYMLTAYIFREELKIVAVCCDKSPEGWYSNSTLATKWALYKRKENAGNSQKRKPTGLYKQLLSAFQSDKSLHVIDACGRAGSCGVACLSLGVKCVVLEKSQIIARPIKQRIGWALKGDMCDMNVLYCLYLLWYYIVFLYCGDRIA